MLVKFIHHYLSIHSHTHKHTLSVAKLIISANHGAENVKNKWFFLSEYGGKLEGYNQVKLLRKVSVYVAAYVCVCVYVLYECRCTHAGEFCIS